MRIRAPQDSRAPQHDARSLTTKPAGQERCTLTPCKLWRPTVTQITHGPHLNTSVGLTSLVYLFPDHLFLSASLLLTHYHPVINHFPGSFSSFTNYVYSGPPIHQHVHISLIVLPLINYADSRPPVHYQTHQPSFFHPSPPYTCM